jgi:hypothetical protein
MTARCAYAVFTTRTDDPPPTLLAEADVPRLDPSSWSLTAVDLDEQAPLREVLSTLAFEREPPIPRRSYPRVSAYRRALVLEVTRDDSLHPDALAFATGAVSALVGWADGVVCDLTAERVWTAREWRRKVARRFEARTHVSVHADWSPDGRTATLHTHGMVKFAHPDFVAFDVPDEGTRAVGQLFGHLAGIRAATLEPLQPGHAFDPGFGQPMVAFVEAPRDHDVIAHLDGPASVVVDFDVETGEAVEGLHGLLAAARALDGPVPADRARTPIAVISAPPLPPRR